MRRAVLLLVVLGLLAGCGAVAGQPVAAGRPRDIRLDGIDPCSLFTPEVRAELGLDRPPRYEKGASFVYRGDVPACDVVRLTKPAFNVSVSFALLDGIELYQPDRVVGTLDKRTVHGFPALLLTPSKDPNNCAVLVDIGPGQIFDVMYADGGDKPPIPQPELCAGAEWAANLTMSALLSQV